MTCNQITSDEERKLFLSFIKVQTEVRSVAGLAAVPCDRWQVVDGAAKLTPILPVAR